MSPTSYQAAPPRNTRLLLRTATSYCDCHDSAFTAAPLGLSQRRRRALLCHGALTASSIHSREGRKIESSGFGAPRGRQHPVLDQPEEARARAAAARHV